MMSEHLTDEELRAAAEQAREIAGHAHSDHRQEELARLQADAAEQLQRNAETLRRNAEELRETREEVQLVAADTRELAADVRATRDDASRVGEAVRATPPVVEPPTDDL
jgi:uncharacterized protein (DUF2252 family)